MASLIDRVQPFLEPDERVRYVVTGQTGINPLFRFLTLWLVVANKPRIVAITNKRVAVFKAGQARWARQQPKQLLYSLARATIFNHGAGAWSKVPVGNERIWMARNTYAFLDKANAEVAASP